MATVTTLPESNAYYTRLSIGPYKRESNFKLSGFDPKLIVHLPLPTELRDDTSVGYTNVNLETVGDMLNNPEGAVNAAVLRNIGNLTAMGLSATSKGLTGALSDRGLGAQLASTALGGVIGSVQSMLSPEQVSSALQQKFGAAPNPNPSVAFQGPVLRDFTFTWAFYPKNKEESARIDKLIRQLKGRALPSTNEGNGSTILNYPHICQLNFYPWDGKGTSDPTNGWTENSIIKIKKCFMQNVNVNYNAFGTPGFFEGTQLPISYQLTISFKEIEYLLSDDWDTTAAGERQVASVQAVDVVSTAVGLAFETGATVVAGVFNAAKELIIDNISNQGEIDTTDNARDAIESLKPGDSESKLTIRTDDSIFPLRSPGLWTVTLNAENKYVVVFDPDDVINARTGNVERPAEDKGTFDSLEAVQVYLTGEDVYADGQITFPPPPEAAAAAPE